MEMDSRPQNTNIKTTKINGRFVSSAKIWRNFGYWSASYETFVWELNEKELGKLLYQTHQKTEKEALKVHAHFVDNFSRRTK